MGNPHGEAGSDSEFTSPSAQAFEGQWYHALSTWLTPVLFVDGLVSLVRDLRKLAAYDPLATLRGYAVARAELASVICDMLLYCNSEPAQAMKQYEHFEERVREIGAQELLENDRFLNTIDGFKTRVGTFESYTHALQRANVVLGRYCDDAAASVVRNSRVAYITLGLDYLRHRRNFLVLMLEEIRPPGCE